jgi:hypothetical protein
MWAKTIEETYGVAVVHCERTKTSEECYYVSTEGFLKLFNHTSAEVSGLEEPLTDITKCEGVLILRGLPVFQDIELDYDPAFASGYTGAAVPTEISAGDVSDVAEAQKRLEELECLFDLIPHKEFLVPDEDRLEY